MEGTRAEILKSIEEWIDDVDGPNLFWLYGHPGTGKSTIATTLRNHLQNTGRLGSSFFFRLQTPETLWCSVAYDLAQQYPAIRRVVLTQLQSHNIDPDGSYHETILDQLIVTILGVDLQKEHAKLPVVVIDALDECGGRQQDTSSLEKLLETLSRWQSLSTQVKIFVTSRDEGDIRPVLGRGGLSSRVLEVGRDVSEDSSRDIKKYLKHHLNQIGQRYKINDPWPTTTQLQSLTNTAAGLFIWASTVVKLVKAGPPKAELDRILQMTTTGWESGTDTLSQLYDGILTSKFTTSSQLGLFANVTGAVIVARTTLTLDHLCQLLWELDPHDVRWTCEQLKSVLEIEGGLRIVHQSFLDFLATLPSNSKFRFNKANHELRLTAACFATMEALHFSRIVLLSKR
ncbi:hypothetical protein B0H13DRAFT_1699421 [Mycena leptocephala]|nr:hypothetical protein B0H13DRAFT_1699421 [Mycena leptocephala]